MPPTQPKNSPYQICPLLNQRTAPIKYAPYSTKEQLLSNMPLYSTKEQLLSKMPPTPGASSHMEVPNQSDPTVWLLSCCPLSTCTWKSLTLSTNRWSHPPSPWTSTQEWFCQGHWNHTVTWGKLANTPGSHPSTSVLQLRHIDNFRAL